MKKIINLLKKFGVITFGKGGYDDWEFGDNNVENKQNNQKPSNTKETKKKTRGKILFILPVIILIIVLFSGLVLDFSFWFWLIALMWLWFFLFIRKHIIINTFTWAIFGKIFMILFLTTIVFIFVGVPADNNLNNDSVDNISSKNIIDKDDLLTCKSKIFKFKKNNKIQAHIIAGYKDKYADRTKDEYTLDELKKFGYEVKLIGDTKTTYLLAQICDGDNSILTMDIKDISKLLKGGNKKGYTHMNFFNELIDQSLINKNKTYQLYGYYSNDKKEWFTSNKKE